MIFSSRNIAVIAILTLFCCAAAVDARHNNVLEDSAWRHGRIELPQGTFSWKMNLKRVEFSDDSGRCVFRAEDHDPGSLALSCGHADDFGFTAFFVRTDPSTGLRRLKLMSSRQGSSERIAYPGDIFSPVLATDHGNVVFAILENFEIIAWELASGRLIWKKTFETPVLFPELIRIHGNEALGFFHFKNGRYLRYHFFTGPTLPPDMIFGPDPETAEPEAPIPPSPEPNERIVLAFGDSITYGYVNKAEAPELGYVPRLQALLDADYASIVVLNAGIPGENTFGAMSRYNQVIPDSRAGYMLFHEGINDTILSHSFPVSATLFNIRTIMQRALELGVKPVLSTIIPRDPAHWTGQEPHRTRAENIRDGIIGIAGELDLPLIDFWTIFEDYPGADGGYLSLMSDYVHPGEKGYQLMANHWNQALLGIPPSAPTGVTTVTATPWKALITWRPNAEFDLGDYLVNHGATEQHLDTQVTVTNPEFTLLRAPFQAELQRERWIQVFARDRFGNIGPGSTVFRVEFPSSNTFHRQWTAQKQKPMLKRTPLKADDRADTPR
ncbi:MAG: SGNH/GDSL hydrolase family protein [Acidobacteriota bacterium]|nr:SGNH/GDSL hydrolase family protein [Acidobacteriota bacterium]